VNFVPKATNTAIESFVQPIRESLNALFKTDKTAIIIIIAALVLAFAFGYMSGRPSVFHDTEHPLQKQAQL
jgi:hypothetical protein